MGDRASHNEGCRAARCVRRLALVLVVALAVSLGSMPARAWLPAAPTPVSVIEGAVGAARSLLGRPPLTAIANLEPPIRSTPLGTFGDIPYVQLEGLFVGQTSTGRFRVPYKISAPTDPRLANRTVLVEPPHVVAGTELRDAWLGFPFLFSRGFVHASVAYSIASLGEPSTLDSLGDGARNLFVHGGGVLPGQSGHTDDEIVVDFARALSTAEVARTLMGPIAHRYLGGLSQSAEVVKRLILSGRAEGVFDFTLVNIALNGNDPQVALADARYTGKVITVGSEFEWATGRTLEDRGRTPDRYRSFFVAGTPHVPDRLCAGHFANRTTPSGWQPALRAHFLQGHEWVTNGIAPPPSTRLATSRVAGLEVIARDAAGNARVVYLNGERAPRMPHVELGEATFVTGFVGTYVPQPPRTIEQLGFVNFDDYLASFDRALAEQRRAGFLLAEDEEWFRAQARLAPQATFTRNYFARYGAFRAGQHCP
jgi:hypothetical protein